MSGVSAQQGPLLVLCSIEQALCGVYNGRIPYEKLKTALFFFSTSKGEYVDFFGLRKFSESSGCSRHVVELYKSNPRVYNRPLGLALHRLDGAIRKASCDGRLVWTHREYLHRDVSYAQLDGLFVAHNFPRLGPDTGFSYKQPYSVDVVEQQLKRQGSPCRVYRPCHME